MLRRVYFFLLVVLVPYFSFGSIKYFGPENGLPERRIFSVTFDGPAKCWVGGENDVYLFNGVQFFSYSHFLDTESSSKGTNHYVLLDRTADTRLLVANTHEIFLLEKSKKVHGKFSKKSLFKTNDNPFEYIFISKDSVLYGWNKDSIFYWHFGMKRPVFMKIKFGHKIEKTISGRLFLIGSFHLYEFKKGILKSIISDNNKDALKSQNQPISTHIYKILSKQRLIFEDNAMYFEMIQNIFKHFNKSANVGFLGITDFNDCFIGPNNTFWFCTNVGLIIYNPQETAIGEFPIKKSIRGIVYDSITGKTAFFYYKGIAICDRNDSIVLNFDKLRENYHSGIKIGRKAVFLSMGAIKNLLIVDFDLNKYEILNLPIQDWQVGIFAHSNHEIWIIGKYFEKLVHTDFKKIKNIESLPINQLPYIGKAVYCCDQKFILLCSEKGFFCFDVFNKKLKLVQVGDFKSAVWVGSDWYAITRNGTLYKGRDCYVTEIINLNELKLFNTAYELAYHIQTKSLWVGTDKGLFLVSSDIKNLILKLTMKDGFLNNEYNTFACSDAGNRLYMGGVNGINYFEPKHFLENYKIELSFYERINLQNNKDYYYLFKSDTLIELEFEENNIRLYYSSLLGKGGIDIFRNDNLIKPNDEQFSNQLDLYGLKPGRNSIVFLKSSFIGIQNSLGIVFKVNYPFYLQWYFLVLILVVIFLVLFIIFRFREKLLKASYLESLEGNREQMFQMIAHDLKSPMNMYTNLLNTIEFLISKKRFEDIKVIRKELIISSRSIDLILNNLLNLGRGKDLISERKDPISLLQLANRLNEIYGTLAKVKNIHFNIECFRDITLYVNEGALQICLQNLVDNAVKYAATEVNVRLNYHLVKQMFVVQVNNDIHPENRERINALLAQLKGKKEVLPGEFGKSLGLVIISRTANRLGAYIRPRLGKRNRLELRLSFKAIAK